MKHLKIATAFAASALFASASAFAAVNADAIHLAVDSLLVASSKMSVVNAIRKNGKPPSTNAEARLGAPSAMTTTEISGIVVNKGGVLDVYLAPVTGTDHGLVQYTPKIVTTKKGKDAVEFSCTSPNIPEIATIAPACKYQPANQPASAPKKK
ncbi:MAG TPA: hypothetical protein VFH71_04255 [Rhodanobacteraceae bacterium]|nr:hypothetical protein [Rhodanobacteraceae bacterium]